MCFCFFLVISLVMCRFCVPSEKISWTIWKVSAWIGWKNTYPTVKINIVFECSCFAAASLAMAQQHMAKPWAASSGLAAAAAVCLWHRSSGSLGIGWQFLAEQNGQAAAAAFGSGGSLFLSSASASIWQVVALRTCGATRLRRYVLAAWQHPFLSSSSASICGCGRELRYALVALCALCATYCLLRLCPPGTRRGLVGAGGEVRLCP